MAARARSKTQTGSKAKRKPASESALPEDGNPVAIAFGLRMRAIRLRQDISQDALAELSALHRTEISLLERGKREPRIGVVIKLAKALRVSEGLLVNELVDYEPPTRDEWRDHYFPGVGEDPPPKPTGSFSIIETDSH
jgi:transcriptional regulator with XRE-family HTH domain